MLDNLTKEERESIAHGIRLWIFIIAMIVFVYLNDSGLLGRV